MSAPRLRLWRRVAAWPASAHPTAVWTLALALPALAAFLERGAPWAGLLLTAAVAALAWEQVFGLVRRRRPSADGLVAALAVCVLVPVDVAAWELALAVSLGVVLGELVFGGRGFGFVSTPAACLAFLGFSFPHVSLAPAGSAIALATLVGGALLIVAGLVSWRVLAAAAVAFAATLLLSTGEMPPAAFPPLAFGAVFLLADPVGAASTRPGRWLYGALGGFLAAVFGGADPVSGGAAMVFATLLANIFAPLVDRAVIEAEVMRRRRRHG